MSSGKSEAFGGRRRRSTTVLPLSLSLTLALVLAQVLNLVLVLVRVLAVFARDHRVLREKVSLGAHMIVLMITGLRKKLQLYCVFLVLRKVS